MASSRLAWASAPELFDKSGSAILHPNYYQQAPRDCCHFRKHEHREKEGIAVPAEAETTTAVETNLDNLVMYCQPFSVLVNDGRFTADIHAWTPFYHFMPPPPKLLAFFT
eukprot:TRINITY_DN6568_c0_g1_i2.p2 TRINITY_DN6568_c0_g1~~TRINITY_DN6568_c0_g1_i2.p2  ORF type:complete len:110 (+),score=8.31 TRINITY_DN6568_c0_g1_i2:813-1142(+)